MGDQINWSKFQLQAKPTQSPQNSYFIKFSHNNGNNYYSLLNGASMSFFELNHCAVCLSILLKFVEQSSCPCG